MSIMNLRHIAIKNGSILKIAFQYLPLLYLGILIHGSG